MPLRNPKVKVIDIVDALRLHSIGGESYSFMPKSGFYFNNNYYVGVQTESWESDEEIWDDMAEGRWMGSGAAGRNNGVQGAYNSFIRGTARDLDLIGATYTISSPDSIANISAGTKKLNIKFKDCENLTAGFKVYVEWINTVTGAIFNQEVIGPPSALDNPTTTFNISNINLTNGSWIIRVKLKGQQSYRLPDDYKPNPAYLYVETDGNTYIYDPEYNIGKIPSNRTHALLLLRNQYVLSNTVKDKPEWITYLSGFGENDGEWAGLKVQVGSGTWTWDNTKLSTVGPVLFKRSILSDFKSPEQIDTIRSTNSSSDYTSNRTYINFDPMARSITWTYIANKDVKDNNGNIIVPKGSCLISGNRMDRSGPVLALWLLKTDNTITLIGTNLNPSTGACECALIDHSATGIKIDEQGILYILSKCSLHKFTPNAPLVEQRLPGIPYSSDGHPGGQSLNIVNDQILFFSEYFGQFGVLTRHFYNFLVNQVGNTRKAGDGTVFHGPNCGDTWLNKLWGIYQDKSINDPTAIQSLAYFDGATWAKKYDPLTKTEIINSSLNFPSTKYFWQRVVTSNNVLHLFGKKPNWNVDGTEEEKREKPIFGVSDGVEFTELNFDYRILKAFNCPTTQEGKDKLICIARYVDDNEEIKYDNYYILEVDYQGDTVPFTYDGSCFITDITNSDSIDNLFKYLWWEDGQFVGHNEVPKNDSICYLSLTETIIEGETVFAYCPSCLEHPEDAELYDWDETLCFNNKENYFSWNSDGCFVITKTKLQDKYGITNTNLLPLYLELESNGECFTPSNTVPSSGVYLIKNVFPSTVNYCLPTGVTLDFDPDSSYGEGNALNLGDDGRFCFVRACPPYNYSDCEKIVVYPDGHVEREHFDTLTSEWVSCDCENAWDCQHNSFPANTKWKVIILPRHTSDINIIQLVDNDEDFRLEDIDRNYASAWMRKRTDTSINYNGSNLEAFLSTFTERIRYSSYKKLAFPAEDNIEICILLHPKLSSIKRLPGIARII